MRQRRNRGLLYAYMEYGADFVTMLNGIFAIVIWDGKLNRLVLYRDRVGVKPLFYALRGNELVFGSEPKALFCHPDITPEVDMDSFRAIFGIGPARIPGCGVFKNIQEIKPGCMGVFSAEGFRESAYWTLIAREHTDDYAQTVETVSYLVRDAVRDRWSRSFRWQLSSGGSLHIVTAVRLIICGRGPQAEHLFL